VQGRRGGLTLLDSFLFAATEAQTKVLETRTLVAYARIREDDRLEQRMGLCSLHHDRRPCGLRRAPLLRTRKPFE
jgi:hypothetical protein